LLDCSPITDGSSCVIFASDRFARKVKHDPIWVRGVGVASGTANLSRRKEFTGLESARLAAKKAYSMAGLDEPLKKIDVAEVHDCLQC